MHFNFLLPDVVVAQSMKEKLFRHLTRRYLGQCELESPEAEVITAALNFATPLAATDFRIHFTGSFGLPPAPRIRETQDRRSFYEVHVVYADG
jgi:hypothetical protein